MRTGSATALAVLALSSLASGCLRDYVARTGGVRSSYESYEHERALEELDTRIGREGIRAEELRHPDSLLYLMDKGMILHSDGRFEESNDALHLAERIADELDIVSVSEEASSLTTTQRRRAYRGEPFERLLVNVLKALNYAALGHGEAALVEVRRANERLRLMGDDEQKAFHQLAIARYVGGVLWEWAGEVDSAVIDYQQALETAKDLGHLVEPLLRLARETGRQELYEELVRRYPHVPHEPLGPNEGQVVVVVSAGLAPVKKPVVPEGELDLLALPYYQNRSWSRRRASVRLGEAEVHTVTLTSIEQVAARHLEQRVARLVGRSFAGVAVKAAVATAIGAATRNEDLGLATFQLLLATNRPDLRSWLSLPAEFQVARARLPAGEHVLEVVWNGESSRHSVAIRPQEITLLPIRRY